MAKSVGSTLPRERVTAELAVREELNKTAGGINTVVLLTSSFTMALGVRAAQTNNNKALERNLLLTIACAYTFHRFWRWGMPRWQKV